MHTSNRPWFAPFQNNNRAIGKMSAVAIVILHIGDDEIGTR